MPEILKRKEIRNLDIPVYYYNSANANTFYFYDALISLCKRIFVRDYSYLEFFFIIYIYFFLSLDENQNIKANRKINSILQSKYNEFSKAIEETDFTSAHVIAFNLIMKILLTKRIKKLEETEELYHFFQAFNFFLRLAINNANKTNSKRYFK